MKSPLFKCGKTVYGRTVICGAFQFADTYGIPLWFLLDLAEKGNCVISIPHYFASAMEHGWYDNQTFGKIQEALSDIGKSGDFERIRKSCVVMFMTVANNMADESADKVGKRMRELIESGV